MDCLEFRRAAGADPGSLGPEALAHAERCASCAGYLGQLQRLDGLILKALQVPLPASGGSASPDPSGSGTVLPGQRRRWMALAASIIGGVLIGTLLWVSGPEKSIARQLVEHIEHEPEALLSAGDAAQPARLDKVLARAGISLRPEIGVVSYARSCPFRGDRVPHLVVQSDHGPVTVMVLRNEKSATPVSFEEHGYKGRIVPAGPGSIAVIGSDEVDLEQVVRRVLAAVQWNPD
jgi:hypothetical protein